MTYQEGIGPASACPIVGAGRYAPKHNPFVFFRDVSGNPPSAKNAYCAAHNRPFSAFAADLARNEMANYVFITPDICNDMHGAIDCGGNTIATGDNWLREKLPRLVDWASAHSGVIFITWDEGARTTKTPFIAIGPGVKKHYAGAVRYDHGSIVKSVEEILGLPILPAVAGKNDLVDLFRTGAFP